MRLKAKLQTVFLSALGGGLEFYDFVIFAIFASSIGHNFFPASSAIATLMESYALFAVGYLVRPIGGILFSHFGDKYGRKKSFAFSISLMAISTLLMSLTPNYESIGVSATILFTLFRLLQGISVGGEIPGALTFVAEHVTSQKGAACAVILVFLNIGILLGHLIQAILHSFLTDDNFNAYGWRIAFLIGGLLALVSFYMRRKLKETDSFIASLDREQKHKIPVLVLLKTHWQIVIKAIFIVGASASTVSIFLLFLTAYLKTVGELNGKLASQISLIQLVAFLIASALASYISDKINRKKLLIYSACYLIVIPPFVFLYFNHVSISLMVVFFNGAFCAIFAGIMPCFLTELFPVAIRFSGVALSYNLGFAIFGGLSPLVSTILIDEYNWITAPGYIVSLTAIAALISLIFLQYSDKQETFT